LEVVKEMTELTCAVAERPPESVVRQPEVLQHAEVEEHVRETLELVVAEVQFVERVVQRVERAVDDRRHAVV